MPKVPEEQKEMTWVLGTQSTLLLLYFLHLYFPYVRQVHFIYINWYFRCFLLFIYQNKRLISVLLFCFFGILPKVQVYMHLYILLCMHTNSRKYKQLLEKISGKHKPSKHTHLYFCCNILKRQTQGDITCKPYK
jgi:hypothetical protein